MYVSNEEKVERTKSRKFSHRGLFNYRAYIVQEFLKRILVFNLPDDDISQNR